MKWTIEDFQADRCDISEVGRPRPDPEPEPIPEVVEVTSIERSLTDMLSVHSREAYIELGGKDYLKANPGLLNKVILRQVEGPIRRQITWETHSHTFADVRREMPWIDDQRLSYQVGKTIRADVAHHDGRGGEIEMVEAAAQPKV